MDDNVHQKGKKVEVDISDDSGTDEERDEKQLDELTDKEVFQMTFDSHEDGEIFYNAYAKVKGFSVRKDNIYRDKSGIVKSRNWVCAREGQRQTKYLEREDRKREPPALTRIGCEAEFRIKLDRASNKYVVANFISLHNHAMIGPLGVPFLRSHRKVSSPDKASANAMHSVGISTSHIIDLAAQQAGGYDSIGFTQKDLYNHFTAERSAEIVDGDGNWVQNSTSVQAQFLGNDFEGDGEIRDQSYW